MVQHKLIHRGERPLQRNECDKTFSQSFDLVRHKEIHKKPFQCNECEEAFTKLYHLQLHKTIHTGGSFKCDECDKTFTRLGNLAQHRFTHTGERPYQCDMGERTCWTSPPSKAATNTQNTLSVL